MRSRPPWRGRAFRHTSRAKRSASCQSRAPAYAAESEHGGRRPSPPDRVRRMDVLVLGGTVFLGRAVVAEALEAGADVTIFNRGVSGTAPRGVEQITGDRTVPADLAELG